MKKLLLPGEQYRRSTIIAPVSDGEGGSLRGTITYVVELRRLDGQWLVNLQWIDLENSGHRVSLPHEVVTGMLRQVDSIMKVARKQRAQRASETRKSKAVSEAIKICEE